MPHDDDSHVAPVPRPTRRRVAFLGAALLAGCETPARAAPPRPRFLSLSDLATWRPGTFEPEAEELIPVSLRGDAYGPLRTALAAVTTRQPSRPPTTAIVQFGDSHTAGPFMVARLRELFQDRFGAVGPGRLPPGRAPRYYRPDLVRVEQDGGWTATSALRRDAGGPFGISGYRLRGEAPGARITLRSTEARGFDRFNLNLFAQPGGGAFRLGFDGRWLGTIPTAAARAAPTPLPLEVRPGTQEAEIEVVGGGPVDLLHWGVERRGRGVIVEGHGINGATIDMLGRLDPAILQRDLRASPPALIILAFGTNEATDERLTEAAYAATLTEHVRRLRTLAPGSGILILGAPEAARRSRASESRAPGCGGYAPLPSLREVQAAQRRVAVAEGVGFWDWSAQVFGGTTCQLDAMVRGTPRLVQDDRIHLTAEGYRLTAERLFAHLMREAAPRGPQRV